MLLYNVHVALSEMTLAPRASAVRASTKAKRIFGRGEHPPTVRHKSDFEKVLSQRKINLALLRNIIQ